MFLSLGGFIVDRPDLSTTVSKKNITSEKWLGEWSSVVESWRIFQFES